MEFFEVIKNLGALVGLFLSVMSAIGVITKMQNKHFKQLFDEHSAEIKKNDEKQSKEIEEIKVTLKELNGKFKELDARFAQVQNFCAEDCRNAIKNIYYQYNTTRKIPLYERKMADSLYKIYSEQFHQNSYGKLLYEEICKWEIEENDKLPL